LWSRGLIMVRPNTGRAGNLWKAQKPNLTTNYRVVKMKDISLISGTGRVHERAKPALEHLPTLYVLDDAFSYHGPCRPTANYLR
jgi:hypothetical protein